MMGKGEGMVTLSRGGLGVVTAGVVGMVMVGVVVVGGGAVLLRVLKARRC